jgi:hypothetical protein
MEQVLVPKFNFVPKNHDATAAEGYDYGDGGYDPARENIGFNEETGQFQIEIKGLIAPQSDVAKRICREDLNEVVTAIVQDKTALERGLFDTEMVPEEITQIRVGRIIREKYPDLDESDQEAIRQHAIAALNFTQQAKKHATEIDDANPEKTGNTALIDGARKFALHVRELDIDLIDQINPFSEAYAILAKTMNAERLKEIEAIITSKKMSLSLDEAREYATRAARFKKERGRLPELTASDPWERELAKGLAAFRSKVMEAQNAGN